METKQLLTIDEAAQLLKQGEVVAFPTETVYGLGADATNEDAIVKIFIAKGRPSDNPLIVHIGDIAQLDNIVEIITDKAQILIDAFWPGPLTIILPKQKRVSDMITAGLSTVAVRMPSHLVALKLLQEVKLPLVAPSANLSGKPSPTTATHVYDDLAGKIAGILDGGQSTVGLESTVIDCCEEIPIILRPGSVTKEEIEKLVGEVHSSDRLIDHEATPKAPGLKYKHYAPNTPMSIVEGSKEFFQSVINKAQIEGKKVGVLVTAENKNRYSADVVLICGPQKDSKLVAQKLYDVLRQFNEYDIDVIYSESFSIEGLGVAVMNRLLKASNYQIIKEK